MKFNSQNTCLPKKLHCIDEVQLADDGEKILFVSLQGVLAAKGVYLFLCRKDQSEDSLLFAPPSAERIYYPSVWAMLEAFKSLTPSTYVLIDYRRFAKSINDAAVIAAAEKAVTIDISLEPAIKQLGFGLLCSLVGGTPDSRAIFRKYKDRLRKDILIHQSPDMYQLRDYAISLGAYSFYTGQTPEGLELRREVFEWADANAAILGWTDDEIAFIKCASAYGKFTIPADWAYNLSCLSADADAPPLNEKKAVPALQPQKNRHYVCLVCSDGDNLQWMLRDFTLSSLYGERCRFYPQNKITWTVSPSFAKLAPAVNRRIAEIKGENDSFIASVSGIGYINPLTYPEKYLDEFTARTARMMKISGMNIVTLLDDNTANTDELAKRRLEYYARFNNIDGGIWELDPDRYSSGKGKIFWAHGKPFMSVRLSLWHLSGNKNAVTGDWVTTQAKKINSFPCDYKSIDGYSVVNIHPWTMSLENIKQFIEQLAPHVEIISAAEMIDMAGRYLDKTNKMPLQL